MSELEAAEEAPGSHRRPAVEAARQLAAVAHQPAAAADQPAEQPNPSAGC